MQIGQRMALAECADADVGDRVGNVQLTQCHTSRKQVSAHGAYVCRDIDRFERTAVQKSTTVQCRDVFRQDQLLHAFTLRKHVSADVVDGAWQYDVAQGGATAEAFVVQLGDRARQQ